MGTLKRSTRTPPRGRWHRPRNQRAASNPDSKISPEEGCSDGEHSKRWRRSTPCQKYTVRRDALRDVGARSVGDEGRRVPWGSRDGDPRADPVGGWDAVDTGFVYFTGHCRICIAFLGSEQGWGAGGPFLHMSGKWRREVVVNCGRLSFLEGDGCSRLGFYWISESRRSLSDQLRFETHAMVMLEIELDSFPHS
ncbi:hypothetical protein J5N97_000901 [Dioscorea zingiberensis]|uniref:Uncharacterized protein n=1 Tax=Dioscorea zingiberensis TaxID=325984 RepID=A0A9D5BV08_9LILI|nr:hypothetical protein J5N97_000901 [Dioscorea zingiberensis]